MSRIIWVKEDFRSPHCRGAYLHTREQCKIIKVGTMVIVNHTIMTFAELRIWVLNATELDSCFGDS